MRATRDIRNGGTTAAGLPPLSRKDSLSTDGSPVLSNNTSQSPTDTNPKPAPPNGGGPNQMLVASLRLGYEAVMASLDARPREDFTFQELSDIVDRLVSVAGDLLRFYPQQRGSITAFPGTANSSMSVEGGGGGVSGHHGGSGFAFPLRRQSTAAAGSISPSNYGRRRQSAVAIVEDVSMSMAGPGPGGDTPNTNTHPAPPSASYSPGMGLIRRMSTTSVQSHDSFGQSWTTRNRTRRSVYKQFMKQRYTKIKRIGVGVSGAVYSAMMQDGAIVAVKEMDITKTHHKQYDTVKAEIRKLRQLAHPYIASYFGAFPGDTPNMITICMELAEGAGSLREVAQKVMGERIKESVAAEYIKQLLEALHYIHMNGIMHRDVKCDNVLITNQGECKLVDFGSSAWDVSDTTGASGLIGTPTYMAPEVMESALVGDQSSSIAAPTGAKASLRQVEGSVSIALKQSLTSSMVHMESPKTIQYGTKADIWSVGVVVLSLLNGGENPWPECYNALDLFLVVTEPSTTPEFPKGISKDAIDFVNKCLDRNPETRPTAEDLLHHAWLDPNMQAINYAGDDENSNSSSVLTDDDDDLIPDFGAQLAALPNDTLDRM